MQVTGDVGGVLEGISYPTHGPVISVMMNNNTLVFFDLITYNKIQTKRFSGPGKTVILDTAPIAITIGAGMDVMEFKEQNLVESFTVTASNISMKLSELYLALESKLAILDMNNFALLRQKRFDGYGSIIGIELTQNHKYIILVASNMSLL